MRISGSYVVFFMSMMGMIFAYIDERYRWFYNDMLKVHNEYRETNGVGKLKLNDKLCVEAAKYLSNKENEEDFMRNYGTNIYFKDKRSILNAREVFQCWYKKKDDVSYKEIPETIFYKEPFKNIVWAGTTDIGVAVFENENFDVILVIYSPRGDLSEEPKKNEKKARSKMLKNANNDKIVRRLF